MRKLSLAEWAQIGEIVGMIAVVLSLLLVAFSINQNTNALQGGTEDYIFERHAEWQSMLVSDASLAAIMVKQQADVELTAVEAIRWDRYMLNLLDVWAMAHERHQQELLSEQQWQGWNDYFIAAFSGETEALTVQDWQALEYGFSKDFWQHVNDGLFAARE